MLVTPYYILLDARHSYYMELHNMDSAIVLFVDDIMTFIV